MTKLFSFSILFISLLFGTKVPEVVMEAFDKKFPDAGELSWDKEDDHTFIASFTFNEVFHKARFTDKGKWQETRTDIEYDKLPEKVKIGFEKNYNPEKIKSLMKSESSTGKFKYVFEIKKLIKTEEIIFSELGKEQVTR